MERNPRPKDPVAWVAAVAIAATLLALWRLHVPSEPFFDEVHYLPAARDMLGAGEWPNREHPLLGKHIIAAGMAIFGDNPVGWRLFSALAGGLAVFAFGRACWYAQTTRFAAIAGSLLLATGFFTFIHARIAMLDIFMVAFLLTALWQCAGAVREPEVGRRRLAVAGTMLGLAMASKWNAIPLAMVPGAAFFFYRLGAGRRRLLLSRRGAPVPGITLAEAALWLGVVPLATYALTFLPAMFFAASPLPPGGLIALHAEMLTLQESVIQPHPYQSRWPEWVLNLRAIWYLYEPVDGAQRGVLLIGNPLTMLLGLPALAWCGWRGMLRGDNAAWGAFVLYGVALGFWIVAAKPVQFYYHYFLPSCFLLAALTFALDAMWQKGRWLVPALVLGGSVAMFAWFYPILSAAPLPGVEGFQRYMWLGGWV